MIEKVKIQGYRIYKNLTLLPNKKQNLIAGPNESGKSTLMEALTLALTGRIYGKSAAEELNPYWFNTEIAEAFVNGTRSGKKIAWPEIKIELFFENSDKLQRFCGAVNSDVPTNACPGVTFHVLPDPNFANEREEWLKSSKNHLPVEFYMIDWRSFADMPILGRPKELATAIIDSRTVRSSTGMDYHMRNILNDGLRPAERAAISVAYRSVKESMSDGSLKSVNERISKIHASLHNQPISLAMDQSSRTSWEGAITPHVDNVPFSMSGQGQQAAIKISLAMDRHSDNATFVMIEEPENHLSHTSLNILLNRISKLAGEEQQLFIATHSSFVINRLGLNSLHLLGGPEPCMLATLRPDTVEYFQKLPGYDTLRMVLAKKVVLVEGPSDEIIFERIFRDKYGKYPMDLGIDVVSMRGLSLQRCLELCSSIDKTVAAIRDNDGYSQEELNAPLDMWLKVGKRQLFVGPPESGTTLEPQLISHNGEASLRSILGIQDKANLETWMTREKTEMALRIAKSEKKIIPPKYMAEAAEFIHG